MIQLVIENLDFDARYTFIVQREHYEQYELRGVLSEISPGCEIVQVDGITEGAACTVLLAKERIDSSESLLIANADQFIEWGHKPELLPELIYSDGMILTINTDHPNFSYVRLGHNDYVSEVAEKRVISNLGTIGVYFWKHGSDFVKYAEQMIKKNIRTNGEFYVCPVYQEAINEGQKFLIRGIDKLWPLGNPVELQNFLEHYKP
jgi:dTDP-glucose pyrophosphorylase